MSVPADRYLKKLALEQELPEWAAEFDSQAELYDKLARTLPEPLKLQRELLRSRI